MIHFIMCALFVAFMIFLVLGFNAQMREKQEKREKLKNERETKK